MHILSIHNKSELFKGKSKGKNKNVIDDMIDIGYNMLDEKFQEKGHELTADKQKNFRNFQEKFEDGDKKTKKGIQKDVETVIIKRDRKIKQKEDGK